MRHREEWDEYGGRELEMITQTENLQSVNDEQFDYTKWQENLYTGMTIEELSKPAMDNKLRKRDTVTG